MSDKKMAKRGKKDGAVAPSFFPRSRRPFGYRPQPQPPPLPHTLLQGLQTFPGIRQLQDGLIGVLSSHKVAGG